MEAARLIWHHRCVSPVPGMGVGLMQTNQDGEPVVLDTHLDQLTAEALRLAELADLLSARNPPRLPSSYL